MSEIDKQIADIFAERLCELMQESRISVDTIAQQLQLNSSAFYKWIRKVSVPNFDNAILLANYFNCSLDYLFGLNDIDVQYSLHAPILPFNEHFVKVLQEKNVSEYRLVKKTGVARSKIASWRKGTSLPSMHSLIAVATALGITLDELTDRI